MQLVTGSLCRTVPSLCRPIIWCTMLLLPVPVEILISPVRNNFHWQCHLNVISIIIMVFMCQPKKELHSFRKWWKTCHKMATLTLVIICLQMWCYFLSLSANIVSASTENDVYLSDSLVRQINKQINNQLSKMNRVSNWLMETNKITQSKYQAMWIKLYDLKEMYRP